MNRQFARHLEHTGRWWVVVLMALVFGSAWAQEEDKAEWSIETQAAALLKSVETPPMVVDPQPWARRDDPGSLPDRAAQWVHMLDKASPDDNWQRPRGCQPTPLEPNQAFCNLHWRKTDALSQFLGRYQDTSNGIKSVLVGKTLARHLNLDMDSSPELRFRWEFD